MAKTIGLVDKPETVDGLKDMDLKAKIKMFKALRLELAKVDEKEIKGKQKGCHRVLSKAELFTMPGEEKPADETTADGENKSDETPADKNKPADETPAAGSAE